MQRALLIGTTDQLSLDAMEMLLRDIGGWCVVRLEGSQAARAEILAALARLESEVRPGDGVLVYFVGHGGIVEIRDLPAPLGGRLVFYLATAPVDGESPFQAVLDVELSLALARIDCVCENVSAIFDSCHSARVVRGPSWELHESPPWLRTLARQLPERGVDALLHPTSHPRIVRLAGSSSMGRSFFDRSVGGRLTTAFVEVVREAGLRIDRLTWDAVAHRVREEAIRRLGCEEQWVTLAGPRQRLLFSRRVAPQSRAVGFVPDECGGGWIRAGALQGVRVGDEWGLAQCVLDEYLRPRWSARSRVTAVDLNRARVEVIGEVGEVLLQGASAHLCGAALREGVRVEGPESVREQVASSAWLAVDDGEVGHLAELAICDGIVEICSHDDRFANARFPGDALGLAAAIERLEEWARVRVLFDVVAACDTARLPITVRLACEQPEPLRVGDRLCLEIECTSASGSWFVNAILIDVAGCPVLLDPSEPDGRELLPGQRETIGEHPHRRRRGLALHWVDAVEPTPRPVHVIVLASRRPIPLGHLVALPREARPRRRARTRGHLPQPRPKTGPELTWEWSATHLQFELAP